MAAVVVAVVVFAVVCNQRASLTPSHACYVSCSFAPLLPQVPEAGVTAHVRVHGVSAQGVRHLRQQVPQVPHVAPQAQGAPRAPAGVPGVPAQHLLRLPQGHVLRAGGGGPARGGGVRCMRRRACACAVVLPLRLLASVVVVWIHATVCCPARQGDARIPPRRTRTALHPYTRAPAPASPCTLLSRVGLDCTC